MATGNGHTEEVESPDIHFEPIVQLQPVDIITMEEEEEELIQLRAKLFRFDNNMEPPEWKERGTGTVKLLRHKTSNLIRVLMRRDKTLKLCANHYVHPEMELKPNCGSEKAWVWTTHADFSDDECKPELLAIRFGNAENAQKWKEKFVEAQEIMKEAIPKHNALVKQKQMESPAGKPKENGTEKGAGDSSESSSDTKQNATDSDKNKDTDAVADKLENLTVKEDSASNKDSQEKDSKSDENSAANKTDDDKVKGEEKKD